MKRWVLMALDARMPIKLPNHPYVSFAHLQGLFVHLRSAVAVEEQMGQGQAHTAAICFCVSMT